MIIRRLPPRGVVVDGPSVQLRGYDVTTGAPSTVLTLALRPGTLAWTRYGTRIAFTRLADAPAPRVAGVPTNPDGATWVLPPVAK